MFVHQNDVHNSMNNASFCILFLKFDSILFHLSSKKDPMVKFVECAARIFRLGGFFCILYFGKYFFYEVSSMAVAFFAICFDPSITYLRGVSPFCIVGCVHPRY